MDQISETTIFFDLIEMMANIATSLTFGAAAFQLYEANKQSEKSAILKRSEYIIELYNTFTNDENMIEAYYSIEYNEFIYNPSEKFQQFDFNWDPNFHGSDIEKKIDKLLGHFSNIGRLYVTEILTLDDLQFFKYEILMIYQNESIQNYLTFLDNWIRIRNITDTRFSYLKTVGRILERNNL